MIAASLAFLVVLLHWTAGPANAAGDGSQLAIPEEIMAPPWLEERAREQLATRDGLATFTGFSLVDRVAESGITFAHRIVDDAGRNWKPNHYDHGNAIAIADVDGDGREDVYFITQVGDNELWRNQGGGRFEQLAAAGVGVGDRISVAASFADIDNDGDADLYVTAVRDGNLLFENDGKGGFTDITDASGLGHRGHSSAAVFFDYNRDGLLDLFLTNVGQYTHRREAVPIVGFSHHEDAGDYRYYVGFEDAFDGHLKPLRTEKSLLFENKGGNVFADVTAQCRLQDTGWSGDAVPIDVNEDGWIDLYTLNMQGHDEYFENQGGEHFVKKSRDVFPNTPWGSMGIQVFDFDNNGHMDIYITDMHSDMSEKVGVEREKMKSRMQWAESVLRSGGLSIYGNAFYRNGGGGAFTEVSDQVGAENYWPWGLSAGDLNADGFQDAFLTSSMNFRFRYGVNSLLLNEGGERFVDAEFILGVEPRRGNRTAKPWFELDCGGADAQRSECEGRDGRLVVWGALGSRSSAIFDLDDDGDLDIVTGEFNDGPMVLVSDLSEKAPALNYLKVALTGSRSNRDGLGARVEVVAGEARYAQIHDGQSGYLAQSSVSLYFGLGAASQVDAVNVSWPSGQRQTVTGPLAANRLLEIAEPE